MPPQYVAGVNLKLHPGNEFVRIVAVEGDIVICRRFLLREAGKFEAGKYPEVGSQNQELVFQM